jgi:hypothetical protein
VYTSLDGATFNAVPITTAAGASGKTVIYLPHAAVRAVRIKVTAARSSYWSIGELQADCSL